jgi:glycosyltransferase involved in cell wall biosynthesis
MKKVVWLIHWPNDIYLNIASELSKYVDIVLIMDKRYTKNLRRNPKIKYIDLPTISNEKIIKFFKHSDYPVLAYYLNLKKVLKEEKPDIIISNLCYFPGTWQAADYCRKSKTDFILQTEMQRYPESRIIKRITKIILKEAKKKLFDTAELVMPWTPQGYEFAQNNFSLNKNKLKQISAGINDAIFFKNVTNKKNKKAKTLKILNVGRFVKYKRHEDLLKMLSYLRDINKDKDIEISFLGEGPLKQEIQNKIDTLKMNNQIKFLDKSAPDKMKDIYSSHDLLVLPSFNEAIGMVVPEAMICGIPVIVSDTAGARMYAQEGLNGYIFKTGDYKDLARKVLLLKDFNRRLKMGLNAEKHIKEKYTVKAVTREFLKNLHIKPQQKNRE